mmetsp:Transcript_84381/g.176611  ORF Transcript_84381/g.176611 Transcript_84381/m.176611 type:complete len:165 (-) Transcript_84381:218-712(-)
MSCRGPVDIRGWGSNGGRGNPVVPRQKEDKEFEVINEELRKKRDHDRRERLAQRAAEGGRSGGFNDRQDPNDRRTVVAEDEEELDDFGRRKKTAGAGASASASAPKQGQGKQERMQAALARLQKRNRPGSAGPETSSSSRRRSPSPGASRRSTRSRSRSEPRRR